jgi:pectate lyase
MRRDVLLMAFLTALQAACSRHNAGAPADASRGRDASGDSVSDSVSVGVSIEPSSVVVAPLATWQFTATVSGATDPSVDWSVLDADCGSVVGGLYTAPAAARTCRVQAASREAPAALAVATVEVRAVAGDMGPLAAFPGAQGGGSAAVGGRGGDVYVVNSVDDDGGSGCGPGGAGRCTLRNCVKANGPRTCVFSVGGLLDLGSPLLVEDPYLTIAGHTAPGSGIQVTMSGHCDSLLLISTHDVVVRYLRLRKGWSGSYHECGTNLAVRPATSGTTSAEIVHSVVVDHCSLEWNQSQGVTVWTWYDDPYRYPVPNAVTFSWNLQGEAIYPHSVAALTGSNGDQSLSAAMVDIDMHHCMMATFNHRMPLFKHGRGRVINNIVYNPGAYSTSLAGGGAFDVIGNVYRPGPRAVPAHGIHLAHENATTAPGIPDVFVHNNFDEQFNPDPTNDDEAQWVSMVRFTAFENGGPSEEKTDGAAVFGTAPERRAARLPAPVRSGIDIDPDALASAATLEDLLLPDVGASRKLDCVGNLVDARDTVDARLVAEYRSRSGKLTGHPCFCDVEGDGDGGCTSGDGGPVPCTAGIDPVSVLDFPETDAGTACADSDQDGMPDAWENDHGLNSTDPSDGPALRANGYSNLEHYLSGRIPNGVTLP